MLEDELKLPAPGAGRMNASGSQKGMGASTGGFGNSTGGFGGTGMDNNSYERVRDCLVLSEDWYVKGVILYTAGVIFHI